MSATIMGYGGEQWQQRPAYAVISCASAATICLVLRESVSDDGEAKLYSGQSGLLGPALADDFPEVTRSARYAGNAVELWPIHEEQRHRLPLNAALHVEPDFLGVFAYDMVRGNRLTALEDPYAMVLTERTARRFFGDADPIGRQLTLDPGKGTPPGVFTVTGVVRLPERSSLRFDVLYRIAPFLDQVEDRLLQHLWTNWAAYYKQLPIQTVVVLKPGADPHELEAQLPAFVERHMDAEIAAHNTYRLQHIDRMHLHGAVDFGRQPFDSATMRYGNIETIHLFSGIAVLILAIACVNFTNLATARASRRAKEVGLRKVSGAHQWQLVRQFLSEALLPCTASAITAVGLVALALPCFERFIGRDLASSILPTDPLLLLLLASVVAVAAGMYPAFVLSAYEPVQVLKGGMWRRRRSLLRRGLVISQFTIAVRSTRRDGRRQEPARRRRTTGNSGGRATAIRP